MVKQHISYFYIGSFELINILYVANRKEIETILTCLIFCSTSRTITGKCRDAVLELIMRNVEHRALDWAERLVDINGINSLIII